MFIALIVARLVHFAAMMILCGSSRFALYAHIGREADVEPATGGMGRRLAGLFQWCAIPSLASALGWLVCVARPDQRTGSERFRLGNTVPGSARDSLRIPFGKFTWPCHR
jgi:hypothetical protein